MNKKNKCSIALLSVYPFPIGFATTNRILAYSKGLTENGIKVDIFIPNPTEQPNAMSKYGDSGIYEGVNYLYTSGRYRSKYKIFRIIAVIFKARKFRGYYTFFIKFIKLNRVNNYSFLIISTDEILSLFVYSLISKIAGAIPIFIFDEFPIPIRHKLKNRIPLWKYAGYKVVLKNISAYISISDELKRYYCKIKKKTTFVLPVIVDASRFTDKKENYQLKKYICYMGNMELSKDNVDNIIRAFGLVSQKYDDIEFHLYGCPNDYDKNIIIGLIDELNLQSRVFLKGALNSKLVPNVLTNSYVLVSSQPNTKRASGGFPTKLGEYLMTGVPTLLTKVGEIDKYVTDNEHVFFAEPDNPNKYAEKLEHIFANYAKALGVAAKAKKHILDNYSHKKQGERLKIFLNEIIMEKKGFESECL